MSRLKILSRWGLKKTRGSAFIREDVQHKLIDYINALVPAILLLALAIVIYEFGFKPFWSNHVGINFWLRTILTAAVVLTGTRQFLEIFTPKRKGARIVGFFGFLFAMFLTFYVLPQKAAIHYTETNRFLFLKLLLYGGILLGFITEISHFVQFLYSKTVNPGILFVGSFLMLILLGAFLLKLPNATNRSITTLEAVFTATSAACVTGLTVVDTATQFTGFGQLIILLLIQVGGLGFMTLTGLLAYAVSGQSSFKTQLAFTEIMSNRKVSNIMRFIYTVVFVTVLIESIGATFLYFSLDDQLFARRIDKLFFSVFHSVSAFCNAGFSTYSYGLYQYEIRHDYNFHLILAMLVILGGMGFPIVFNLYRYLRIKAINFVHFIFKNPSRENMPNVIMLNSRLALLVNLFLLLLGFVAYIICL